MALMKSSPTTTDTPEQTIVDGIGSDPQALEANAGAAGRALIRALDKAVAFQSSAIEGYVERLRRKNPDASPAEIQEMVDKHFLRIATGTGAGAGAAAAIPGIGFFTGAAAIAGESVVFLDAAAWYTMASANLRGIDISDQERRKALILVSLLGAKGSAVVDAVVGDVGKSKGLPTMSTVARFSAPRLTEANNRLVRLALRSFSKRLRRAWLGKLMPLGIGAIAGTIANRKLTRAVIANTRESLGMVPASFASPVAGD
ncbi:hypothetical protein [Corynebacterium sp.]|uniref:hypothetical protein n=1 Tax=Corynebacterium sp. TaxID=1720 RepID=UPI0026DF3C78|nr:hypothetical protein [Corynebacterium sp.]MDO5511939.1 hypothetical protein [Corynebacterium sp.]